MTLTLGFEARFFPLINREKCFGVQFPHDDASSFRRSRGRAKPITFRSSSDAFVARLARSDVSEYDTRKMDHVGRCFFPRSLVAARTSRLDSDTPSLVFSGNRAAPECLVALLPFIERNFSGQLFSGRLQQRCNVVKSCTPFNSLGIPDSFHVKVTFFALLKS